jgi:hypothetical protein
MVETEKMKKKTQTQWCNSGYGLTNLYSTTSSKAFSQKKKKERKEMLYQ